MKWEKVKDSKELQLEGIIIDAVLVGSEVKTIRLTDVKGKCIQIQNTSYATQAFVPAPPEKVKKFRVTAKVCGIDVAKDYDEEFEAKQKQRELDALGEGSPKLEEVEVEIPF